MTQGRSEQSSSIDPATDPASASALEWLADWGAEVLAVRLDEAKARFDADVSAFGTYSDVLHGLDELHARQWSRVWPTIEDFAFDLAATEVLVSPDGVQAVLVAPWTSTGIAEDGSRFDRPGRATIVVRRTATDAAWFGVHTHFSLARGVPQQSFGSTAR
ncbi:MAG: nuclear transport factor 2 family protein [Ilumatobacteraceae bacterium]